MRIFVITAGFCDRTHSRLLDPSPGSWLYICLAAAALRQQRIHIEFDAAVIVVRRRLYSGEQLIPDIAGRGGGGLIFGNAVEQISSDGVGVHGLHLGSLCSDLSLGCGLDPSLGTHKNVDKVSLKIRNITDGGPGLTIVTQTVARRHTALF